MPADAAQAVVLGDEPVGYVSTRGASPRLGFADVLLGGLAPDGGLYLPDRWPALPAHLPGTYAAAAAAVTWPFVVGSVDLAAYRSMVEESYATFDHPDVVPVTELSEGLHLVELFHGPTLAFKDVALQLVGRLFDHELTARGERVTIVGATSGDTGSAAIEACRDRKALDVFILHPAGRVSEVQRRQMTTVDSPNIHNLAVEGTFDDCQDLVKAMFADVPFRQELRLSAVNSINWARVMAQVVYYATSARAVRPDGGPVSFSVPTGNFGNVFAGWVARRMGTPIRGLTVASNRNDILTRFFNTGVMRVEGVVPTISPSMDIQVSSNLERLLYELLGEDGHAVTEFMTTFRARGVIELEPQHFGGVGEVFDAVRVDEQETARVMAAVYADTGRQLDPHTAVGVGAALARGLSPDVPTLCLATAHPAKFPDAVEAATGVRPPLPPHLADLLELPEHFDTVPADLATIQSRIRSVLAGR